MTVLAKTHTVRTKTEFNFIGTVYRLTDTLNIYPLNVNWSAFLKGILQPSKVLAGTMVFMEGTNWAVGTCHQLAMWPTGVSLATVWASWLLMGKGFCHLPPTPSHLTPPHHTPPTPLPIPPTPSISNTNG